MTDRSWLTIEYRHECTSDDPWDKSKSFYGDHPDAERIEERDKDGASVYLCPNCGLKFREWPDTENWKMLSHKGAG